LISKAQSFVNEIHFQTHEKVEFLARSADLHNNYLYLLHTAFI